MEYGITQRGVDLLRLLLDVESNSDVKNLSFGLFRVSCHGLYTVYESFTIKTTIITPTTTTYNCL